MNIKKHNHIRTFVAIFIAAIVAIAAVQDSLVLAIIGIFTGLLFLVLVRSKTKIVVDEREKTVREKAAQMTYAIFAPTIGIGSFLLLMISRKTLPVLSKGEFIYLESLGTVLAYLTLFLIALYAVSYHFLNRKYGGGGDEE